MLTIYNAPGTLYVCAVFPVYTLFPLMSNTVVGKANLQENKKFGSHYEYYSEFTVVYNTPILKQKEWVFLFTLFTRLVPPDWYTYL